MPTPEELSTVQSKVATARGKKDTGDAAFKAGDVKSALRSYHETLMYLIGIDKNALKSLGMGMPSSQPSTSAVDQAAGAKEELTEADMILEKVYANMSACHIKQENWKRAVDTADKALSKNPANTKALFRKAKAFGELGYFEKAEAVLNEIKKVAPNEAPMADAEIARQKAMDRERQKAHDQKMRGWLSREKKPAATE
ncbi:TPR-like protein [Rhizopogon vinicolor AM-OR11-026]|uniref:TPR-like protein n=1 Tax=Rhizopogon vinicolor AM-OR11-026 TaxID=1314800 RepID=A0A1B7MXG2_9AGAM|nr:TPR-like protein [Rhizopogon vinicolor AM-OR11-026]